nr:MAG TPA: hypothetical protein [Caudoviricetes sp.]
MLGGSVGYSYYHHIQRYCWRNNRFRYNNLSFS